MELIAIFAPILILTTILLDVIFPDPNFKLHPIRIIGLIILFFERKLFKINLNKKILGLALLILVLLTSQLFFIGILFILLNINIYLSFIYYILISYFFLSTKTLISEGGKVFKALEKDDIEKARNVSQGLVSRNLDKEEKHGIIRATLESMSENMSDGVVAPILFLMFFGLPGVIFYKTVNTLDSMVGYKNKKYIDFGFFSAKFDDILNYIPARVTGLLILLLSLFFRDNFKKGISSWKTDASKGESPNGGIPIVTFAGAIGIKLGGDVFDKNNNIVKVPYVGGDNIPTKKDIKKITNYISGSILILVVFYFMCIIFLN